MWNFYRQCVIRAFSRAWDAANAVSLLVGVGGGVAIWRLPQFRTSIEPLFWLVPAGAFLGWFIYRFAHAPFELHQELKQQLAAARQIAVKAEDSLKEHRDCQRIADFLTERHKYGVHELLHKPPSSEADLETWRRWVHNWNDEIFLRMRQFGCTPQDLNHVETITANDLPLVSGSALEVAIKMHFVRLNRIADVSTKYATRAEQLKLLASK